QINEKVLNLIWIGVLYMSHLARSVQDMLFVLICLANSLNIDLEDAHNTVMNKFNTRDKDRWTRIDTNE
ncbi:MazG nucleotide pyrophosphohydrolase domain-containing protein, partial [Ferdinandcohnia sp. SAFN-114]|uniref:MazG nucleotide pyrophosphohydrolase domain-containing protein n=1 Tax=Ferdinandcohnia sp. SAFN-114 TaxID=3387275 RepID=UPI003F82045D